MPNILLCLCRPFCIIFIHYSMFMQLQFADFWKQLTHTAIDSEQYEVLKTNLLGILC